MPTSKSSIVGKISKNQIIKPLRITDDGEAISGSKRWAKIDIGGWVAVGVLETPSQRNVGSYGEKRKTRTSIRSSIDEVPSVVIHASSAQQACYRAGGNEKLCTQLFSILQQDRVSTLRRIDDVRGRDLTISGPWQDTIVLRHPGGNPDIQGQLYRISSAPVGSVKAQTIAASVGDDARTLLEGIGNIFSSD